MHRRRHRTRITFPSTTPVAWDQELGLPCWDVLQTKKGVGMLPGWRGTHTRSTHMPSWVKAAMHPKVWGAEPSTTLRSPWLVRPSSRTLSGMGLGSRGGHVFTDTSFHLSVGDGRNGSCRVSAHARQQLLQVLSCPGHLASQLGHHLAGKGPSSAKRLGWVCAGSHFAQGNMGSRPLQPCASSTAPAMQGRNEPAPAQQPQRGLETSLSTHSSTFLAASCRRFPLE